jgi:hypothetical protein
MAWFTASTSSTENMGVDLQLLRFLQQLDFHCQLAHLRAQPEVLFVRSAGSRLFSPPFRERCCRGTELAGDAVQVLALE